MTASTEALAGQSRSDDQVTGAELASSLDRFVFNPAEHARYVTDVVTAAGALRTGTAAIAELTEHGLPYRDSSRGPLFDYDDLMNVGMFSGTGKTVPELGLRYLMRFAAGSRESWFTPRTWRVQVRPKLRLTAEREGAHSIVRLGVRLPAAGDGVEILGLTGESERELVPGSIADEGFDTVVRLEGTHVEVDEPAVVEVWRSVLEPLLDGSVIYQTVSEAMRVRQHESWQAGAADCVVAARVLRDRLVDAGFAAVVQRGYLLGIFGSDHAWCVATVDGTPVYLDPIFAFVGTLGSRARGVEPSPQFAAECFGSRFNRLLPCAGDDGAALVTIDGAPAPYWSLSGVSAKPYVPQADPLLEGSTV